MASKKKRGPERPGPPTRPAPATPSLSTNRARPQVRPVRTTSSISGSVKPPVLRQTKSASVRPPVSPRPQVRHEEPDDEEDAATYVMDRPPIEVVEAIKRGAPVDLTSESDGYEGTVVMRDAPLRPLTSEAARAKSRGHHSGKGRPEARSAPPLDELIDVPAQHRDRRARKGTGSGSKGQSPFGSRPPGRPDADTSGPSTRPPPTQPMGHSFPPVHAMTPSDGIGAQRPPVAQQRAWPQGQNAFRAPPMAQGRGPSGAHPALTGPPPPYPQAVPVTAPPPQHPGVFGLVLFAAPLALATAIVAALALL
jgi:hypothetical protein